MDVNKVYMYIENSDKQALYTYMEDISKNMDEIEKQAVFTTVNSLLFSKCRPFIDCKEVYECNQKRIETCKFSISDLESYNFIRENSSKDGAISQALSYIDDNIQNKLSLELVADQVHLSKNYFSNLFKAEVGMCFSKYINLKRIELAKKLLIETDSSIDYIAFECGFNSLSHFSSTFSNIVGISPSRYRARLV